MDNQAAYSYLKRGHSITLPEWGGYWSWHGPRQTIVMHTRTGAEIDIRSSDDWDYTQGFMFRDDWQLVDDIKDTEHYAARQQAAEPPPLRMRDLTICPTCQERHPVTLPCPADTVV